MTGKQLSDFELLNIRLNNLERYGWTNSFTIEDTYALGLLQPIISGYPLLPFSGSSLRPFCLAHIINDIIINSRNSIIEFGSGISTIMIGRLIKKNKLDTKIVSIEHDEGWVKVLSQILRNEQIDDVIELQYIPLTTCKLAIDNNDWYDLKILKDYTNGKKFDMVIIDGPPAWEVNKSRARYPAVPFISNKLAKKFSIYLDDAVRAGEQDIIKLWESEYGVNFKVTGKTLAYYYGGEAYYTEPFIYY